MTNYYGQFGWKEFHSSRREILHQYDKTKEQTSNRPVRVAHGTAVEASIREWLSDFLPKKYGITSGYIIPDLYDENQLLRHFDIIIYDCLESPVLWTEGDKDSSEQGRYRAIPAKHVLAVYEVKSTLNKRNVIDALEKLDQTKVFNNQFPSNYSCGVIFIELKEPENNSAVIVKSLHQGRLIHGFVGGMVLRYENDETAIGEISIGTVDSDLIANDSNGETPLAKKIDDLEIFGTEDGAVQLIEPGGGAIFVVTAPHTWSVTKTYGTRYSDDGICAILTWSRSGFSNFCINLIGNLQGLAFDDKRRPSFGRIFDKIELKKAPAQFEPPLLGKPFLSLMLDDTSNSPTMEHLSNGGIIKLVIEVENKTDIAVEVSDDGFKQSFILDGYKKIRRFQELRMEMIQGDKSLHDILLEHPVEASYRLVYKVVDTTEFYSIEKKFLISTDGYKLL